MVAIFKNNIETKYMTNLHNNMDYLKNLELEKNLRMGIEVIQVTNNHRGISKSQTSWRQLFSRISDSSVKERERKDEEMSSNEIMPTQDVDEEVTVQNILAKMEEYSKLIDVYIFKTELSRRESELNSLNSNRELDDKYCKLAQAYRD